MLLNKISKLTLLLLLAATQVFGQQELLFQTQTNLWQANTLNPAFFPADKKVAIGIGAFSLDLGHSGDVAIQDFFRESGGKTYLDFSQVLDKLEASNEVRVDSRIETVSFGLKRGKWGLLFNHALRQNGGGDYPKSLPALIWEGNGKFIGQTLDIAPAGSFEAFNEIGVGLSRKIGLVTVAGRMKFLSGAAAFESDPDHRKATVYTNPDIYQLTLETDYTFRSAVIVNGIDTSGLAYDINWGDVKRGQLFSKNRGFGLDLGITAKLGERLQVSASILDLGAKINWKDNANEFKSKGKWEYAGVEIPGTDIISGADDIDFSNQLDEINDIFKFEKKASEFETKLPTRIYLGANLKLTEKLGVAGSLFHLNGENRTATAAGVSGTWSPLRWLAVGAMYAVNDQSATNIGFHTNLKIGPLQGYFVSDNLLNVFQARTSPNLNFRIGGSLVF